MLIQFKVGNFRSFDQPVTFSMVASPLQEHRENNVAKAGKLDLLKTAVLYGANASGKSNLIMAMRVMRNFVIYDYLPMEQRILQGFTIPLPFLLNKKVKFDYNYEISFWMGEQIYTYGFITDEINIKKEWLSRKGKGKAAMLFHREREKITVGPSFKGGKGLAKRTRPDSLFLAVAAQWNVENAKNIHKWFEDLEILAGINDKVCRHETFKWLEDEKEISAVMKLLKMADVGIDDLKVTEDQKKTYIGLNSEKDFAIDYSQKKKSNAGKIIKSYHKIPNVEKTVEFIFDAMESEGTKKLFDISGSLLKTLKTGGVLLVDEFDARFHPLIARELIKLFHSPQNNPHNAQLIFTSHDTNFLDRELFRRDQIWFTEKNPQGATDLYSLAEFKEVRNDAAFGKNYLQGKYGAVPFINPTQFFDLWADKE